ncbi:MAG: response regulator [bacterium]|nr:response regulator [bacterium]
MDQAKKILVVDDDQDSSYLIQELIELCFDGVVVSTAVNGKDGWQKFQENQPDVVITDLEMETRDAGFLLAKIIKTISPNTLVIMVTGANLEKPDCVDSLLSKPFEVNALRKEIQESLERR